MSISYDFQETGIPYYRGQDTCHTFIEDASPVCISEKSYRLPVMLRSHIRKGDVLLSIVGTVGNSSLVYEDNKATCSCKLAILRSQDKNIYSEYLAVFCKTKYGQNQIQKFRRGTVQTGLLLEDMDQIFVPTLDLMFQEKIVDIIKQMYALNAQAKGYYSTAKNLLLSELGLANYSPSREQISVRRFKDVINSARIDAEFYQPKYDSILNAITHYDVDAMPLDKLACYLFTGECAEEYYEYDESLCHFVRGTDIHDGLVDVDFNYAVKRDKHSKFLSTGDIITGRVGTIGRFGVVPPDLNGAVCSDNVLCFRLPDEYLPNVYALYFNSPAIKELTERMSRGSVQQRLNQETLRGLLVPYIRSDLQANINDMIDTSFSLRLESEELLACSIHAVEIAIERDEKIAIKYLEDNL